MLAEGAPGLLRDHGAPGSSQMQPVFSRVFSDAAPLLGDTTSDAPPSATGRMVRRAGARQRKLAVGEALRVPNIAPSFVPAGQSAEGTPTSDGMTTNMIFRHI